MKKSNSATGISIEDLFYDILIRIFLKLNIVELSVASMVCKSWNEICRNPLLWRKVDLSRLSSRAFNIPLLPEVWRNDSISKDKLIKFLKYALSLSNHNTSCLVFNFFIHLRDAELIFVAERTPNLRRLVLPFSGSLSMNGIESAMKLWVGLESITITAMVEASHIFSAISKFCKNISQMKFTSNLDISEADLMIKYTPNLKLLSVRNVMVNLRALCNILNSLENLEVVNICHSLIWDRVEGALVVYTIRDLRNHLSLSCLQKLMFCNRRRCLRCRNGNDPVRGPFGVFEDIWCEDEIRSLAH